MDYFPHFKRNFLTSVTYGLFIGYKCRQYMKLFYYKPTITLKTITIQAAFIYQLLDLILDLLFMRSCATGNYSDTEMILLMDWIAASGETLINMLCDLAVGNLKLLALCKKGFITELGLHSTVSFMSSLNCGV